MNPNKATKHIIVIAKGVKPFSTTMRGEYFVATSALKMAVNTENIEKVSAMPTQISTIYRLAIGSGKLSKY